MVGLGHHVSLTKMVLVFTTLSHVGVDGLQSVCVSEVTQTLCDAKLPLFVLWYACDNNQARSAV